VKSSITVLRVLVKFDFVTPQSNLINIRPIYVWIQKFKSIEVV